MLDRDLAELYGVPLKRLNEQVKRNSDRFPDDFMFGLTMEEATLLMASSRSQIATMNRGQNVKYAPHVFTEHGAACHQPGPGPQNRGAGAKGGKARQRSGRSSPYHQTTTRTAPGREAPDRFHIKRQSACYPDGVAPS
jgi:mono/diheme cytochrome c family protein